MNSTVQMARSFRGSFAQNPPATGVKLHLVQQLCLGAIRWVAGDSVEHNASVMMHCAWPEHMG